jgi:cytochrome c oxidase cbb3-type subunit 2
MPRSPWLFAQVMAPVERGGGGPRLARTADAERYFTFRKDRRLVLFPDASGLVFVPPPPDGEWPLDGTPVLDLTPLPGRPLPLVVRLVMPTQDLVGLVRYLQRLGASRGAWRDVGEPPHRPVAMLVVPETASVLARGEAVYRRRCLGCHGVRGDGNGPAATFLVPRPRDFTAGVFKFKTTPSGSLPTDDDLYQTISRGLRWTAMPAWDALPAQDRRAVIAYIKTFSRRWKQEAPEPAVTVGSPPPPTAERLARGAEVYRRAMCWECHGAGGRGDGPAAAQLRDDFDLPSRPTDFAGGRFKGGVGVADVFRALTVGLDGSPMPSFADALGDDDRWALSYHVLALSAWTDPLTGERLALPAETGRALSAAE